MLTSLLLVQALMTETLTFDPVGYDVGRLSHAVSCAETSCGTKGTALSKRNAHGIMCWPNGKRTPCTFASLDESDAAFVRLWLTRYKRFPDLALARKYTGSDNAERWLSVVQQVYYAQ